MTILDENFVVNTEPLNYNPIHLALFERYMRYSTFPVDFIRIDNVNISAEGVLWRGWTILRENRFLIKDYTFYSRPINYIRFLLINYLKRKPSRVGSGACWIINQFSTNYYHWMVEALPRLLLLRQRVSDLTLLLPNRYESLDYVRHTLQVIGVEEVIYFDPASYRFNCSKLHLISPFSKSGYCHPLAAGLVRDLISSHLNGKKSLHAKSIIYVSRQKAKKRHITNEDDLLEVLHQFGAAKVYFEEMSWTEQLALVSTARVLIGLHGAGLTNMLSMKRGSAIIEIRNSSDTNGSYYSLAGSLGHRYYYIVGHVDNPASMFNSDFTLSEENMSDIAKILETELASN